jgi:hypothetical protein
MNIAILTNNEDTIYDLLGNLIPYLMDEDRIYITDDSSTPEYFSKLSSFCKENSIVLYQHSLNKDFSRQRNFMHDMIPQNEWIIWLDSDEMVDVAFLGCLRSRIQGFNTNIVYCMPRINIYFDGEKFDFSAMEMDWVSPSGIAYPDHQGRIVYNTPSKRWTGTVHEIINSKRENLSGKEFTILHCRNTGKPKRYK